MPGKRKRASKRREPVDAPIVVLIGKNHRLRDNSAFWEAAASRKPVIPLYIINDDTGEIRHPGAAATWWRGRSLIELDRRLRGLGSRIVLRRGGEVEELRRVLREAGATTLHVTWRTDAHGSRLDRMIIAECAMLGVGIVDHPSNYLHDPAMIKTTSGGPYRVFTPFWKILQGTYSPPRSQSALPDLRPPVDWPGGIDVAEIALTHDWTKSLARHWTPGEDGAHEALDEFIMTVGEHYAERRDRPDLAGTSRLSPYLAWGEINVHEVWRKLKTALGKAALPYLRQLAWRDFNMHLTSGFGDLSRTPLQPRFEAFPFVADETGLNAWRRGMTGYPIVDAGMREIWATGWMHNRIRMISASFLVKDLLVDWRLGEAWFWDTLVDADAAQNPGNWQWVAGCGADAAPYFRVFNPVTQGRRFDPLGNYVRRWVPELANIPDRHIHAPWEATPVELGAAGVALGRNYPRRILDHGDARIRALAAYKRLAG